jgi:hypothetical protein
VTGSARFTEAFYGGVLLPCRVREVSHAADLWHHGAESQRLVLSRHDVLPEITDPGAHHHAPGPVPERAAQDRGILCGDPRALVAHDRALRARGRVPR